MNDPLKKYIHDNRDDFDNLEPAADIFSKLKKELNPAPKEENGIIRLLVSQKWVIAASILIIASITYFFATNTTIQTADAPQIVKHTVSTKTSEAVKEAIETANSTPKVAHRKYKKQSETFSMPAVYRDLNDSTSASTRLAAILKIQKSNTISYDMIDKLSQTLNHDSNSNVRLAALNLMSKYAQDSYVNNAFMLSLSNQKDPLLQLGLMELLSQTDNPKLDDKLYALANDPTTLAEVKDQAYFILLNQNKL